ncbi:hypothetical protein ACUN29_00900 [Streptomyces sp. WC2508]|uniref:hypothetical protein n=1 Tax=Streptomyces sp. WC2508 TaxID=3461405 RepID=UPI004043CA52
MVTSSTPPQQSPVHVVAVDGVEAAIAVSTASSSGPTGRIQWDGQGPAPDRRVSADGRSRSQGLDLAALRASPARRAVTSLAALKIAVTEVAPAFRRFPQPRRSSLRSVRDVAAG